MKNRWWREELQVGIVVIVAIALLLAGLIIASNLSLSPVKNRITIYFSHVSGLLENAPVHMYGMEIGKVDSIKPVEISAAKLGEQADGVDRVERVKVDVVLRKEVEIREGYGILIDMLGLVGEKYIDIVNGPVNNPPANNDFLTGKAPQSVSRILMRADDITKNADKAMITATETMDSIKRFIGSEDADEGDAEGKEGAKLIDTVNELNTFIAEMRNSVKKTMGNVDTVLKRVDNLAECTEGDISRIATSVRVLTEELNNDRSEISTLARNIAQNLDQTVTDAAPAIDQSLSSLQEASSQLPVVLEEMQQNVGQLSESTSKLVEKFSDLTDTSGEKLEKGLDEFNKSAAVLSGTVEKLDRLLAGIEEGRGTLGKLIVDDEDHNQLSETMESGKRAADDVGSFARRLDGKLAFLDTISMRRGYELSYSNQSESLQNHFVISSPHYHPYFYLAGLSIREGEATYSLQAGRKFGGLVARAGAIRSRAGIGLDYWPFARRIGFSVEGLGITEDDPELDAGLTLKIFGDLYFIFGAENLTGDDIGLNFGIRAEME